MLQVRLGGTLPDTVTVHPLCVRCKEEGHAFAYCPTRGKQMQLQIMGGVMSGEGFFCMQFDEDEGEAQLAELQESNGAIICAEHGLLSLRILEEDLKHKHTKRISIPNTKRSITY